MITALSLAASLLISITLLIVVVGALWWFDRRGRESLRVLALVFLWGAVGAPLVSAAFWATVAGAGISAGGLDVSWHLLHLVVDEGAKASIVLLLAARSSSLDSPTDGLVLGTAAGLGFAVFENTNLGAALAQLQGGVSWSTPLAMLALAGCHALATSIVGGCGGLAQLSRGGRNRALLTVAGILAAVVVRSGCVAAMSGASPRADDPGFSSALVVIAFGLWLLVVAFCVAFERRIIDRELGEEASLAVVPPWVVEVIPYYRRRIRSNWWPLRAERIVLASLLTKLAFRKHVMDLLPPEDARVAGLEVVQLRARVRRLLAVQPPPGDS
jgi:hypothetical protein